MDNIPNCYLLGIDPGSSSLGLAILELDSTTFSIVTTTAYTIEATKLELFNTLDLRLPERERRLRAISKAVSLCLEDYKPLTLAIESPFFNSRKPSAYAVLIETMYVLKQTARAYDLNLPIIEVDPPTAKKAIGVRRLKAKERRRLKLTTKDLVREALLPLTALKLASDIDSLDEHSLDAIAVVYSSYKQLLARL